MSSLWLVAVAAALLVTSPLANAAWPQRPPATPSASITRLDCTFTASAAGTWVAGDPQVDVTSGLPFSFQIEDIDTSAGSARVTLGAASVAVVAHAAGSNLHFIDRPSESSMAMTTVFTAQGREAGFRAVHSRTDYRAYNGPGFVAVPQVEQLYGYCQAPSRIDRPRQ